jgi:hypothetical protein
LRWNRVDICNAPAGLTVTGGGVKSVKFADACADNARGPANESTPLYLPVPGERSGGDALLARHRKLATTPARGHT